MTGAPEESRGRRNAGMKAEEREHRRRDGSGSHEGGIVAIAAATALAAGAASWFGVFLPLLEQSERETQFAVQVAAEAREEAARSAREAEVSRRQVEKAADQAEAGKIFTEALRVDVEKMDRKRIRQRFPHLRNCLGPRDGVEQRGTLLPGVGIDPEH
jgi:hypothetical protein